MINPTDSINVSFKDYVTERTMAESEHLVNGVPDYAFASDYTLRQKIRNMPGVYKFFEAALDYQVPLIKQIINTSCLKVTSRQFSNLHDIVGHCAKTLGIGMPTLYVMQGFFEDGYTINACTYATDDTAPIVIISSASVERLDEDELVAMIGHECGHIHNNHSIYETAVNALVSGAGNGLNRSGLSLPDKVLKLMTFSVQSALNTWSRAAEVTCDRAGCICCGGAEGTLRLMAKLLSGGVLNNNEYDIDEIIKQYDDIGSAVRYQELMMDHPISVRRMIAAREFVKSDAFYKWCPDKYKSGERVYTKEELDLKCNNYVSIFENKKR